MTEQDKNSGLASPEARALLAELAAQGIPKLTRESLPQMRQQSVDGYTPLAERAVKRTGVTLRNLTIAGVDCIEVMPTRRIADRTLIYCYGGGYVSGSAFLDLIISAPLADLTGARVIAPNYRLAPEHVHPAAVDDGFAVYRAVAKETPATSLAISGESAGGNLALAILQRAHRAGLAMPAAAALLSPWCDLGNRGDSHVVNDGGRDPTLDQAMIMAMSELYTAGRAMDEPAVSPIYGTFGPWFPPAIITTGTRDLLMSQCIRLAGIMRAAGVSVDLRVHDGMWHVFEYYDELPEAARSLGEIGAFLSAQFEAGDA